MATRRRRTTQQKIVLLIIPICLVPAVVFLTLVAVYSRVLMQDAIGAQVQRNTEILAGQFDTFLSSEMARVRGWTMGGDDSPRMENGRAIEAPLAVLEWNAAGEHRLIEGDAGSVAQQTIVTALDGRFREWWTERAKLDARGAIADAAFKVPGRVDPSRVVVLIYPDAGGGVYFYIVDAALWVERLRDTLNQAPEFFIIHSDEGQLIYSSRALEKPALDRVERSAADKRATRAPFTARVESGTYLMAPVASRAMLEHRHWSGFGAVWSVFLPYDMAGFLEPQDWFIWLSVLIVLGLALIMLISASFAAHRLMLPLADLKRQAELLARGELEVRASVESRDEFGDLAESFNIMAGRLRATYRWLEERAEENRLHAEHISVINEMANAVLREQNLDAIFDILRRQIGRIMPLDAMWIALFDGEGEGEGGGGAPAGELRVSQIDPVRLISLFDGGRIPLNWSLHGQVVASRETLHAEIGPHHRTEFFETRIFNAEGFQSYLIAPLPSHERILGTITVATGAPDSYNAELISIMSSLARGVAVAIEHAGLFQQISRFAGELEHKVAERTKELAVATQKLIQTEKYFATGRLAGNIAHEINNPLGIIKNYLQLVRNTLQEAGGGRRAGDPNVDHLRVIDEEVNRIARLVRQMMDLHRPVEQAVQAIQLNALVGDTISIMEQSLKRNAIEVTLDFAGDLPTIMASPDLLRQLIINLVRNAQDAMENGGKLTIRTSAVIQWVDGADGGPGGERQIVHLRVSDTGCGIAPEDLSQIFDPFFTTKPQEKGTGLGLCVSFSIVQIYRGTIEVESEVDRGTTFIVSLPASASPEPQAAAAGGTGPLLF